MSLPSRYSVCGFGFPALNESLQPCGMTSAASTRFPRRSDSFVISGGACRQSGDSWVGLGGINTSPEAATGALGAGVGYFDNPYYVTQATWTSPVNSRLLLEASFGLGPWARFGGQEIPGNNRALIPVIEAAGPVPGIEYRGQGRAAWARRSRERKTAGSSPEQGATPTI